jgi:hypothetical protein
MADLDYINKSYKQQADVCAMASYGAIIEYFSEGRINIHKVFDQYIKSQNLPNRSFGKALIIRKEEAITKHFHEHCQPIDMRGFAFIQQLHNADSIETRDICEIKSWNALRVKITDNEIQLIRSELIDNEALAMVLYKVSDRLFHAVTIGYDSQTNEYFCKDPEKKAVFNEDILSTKNITEYIVFNDYESEND